MHFFTESSRDRRRFRTWSALLLGAITAVGLTGADARAPVEWCDPLAPLKPQPASTRKMVQRLAGLEAKAKPFANRFFTPGAIKALRERMTQVTPNEAMPLKPRLAEALLNDGQSAAALKEFEDYERSIAAGGLALKPEFEERLLMMKALCQLRLGEQENCLLNHNGDSCVFPIRDGGVHQRPDGSRAAIELLQQVLETNPARLDAIWLLNIGYQTLGTYPEAVPQRWRLDPKIFESEYDIQRFPDVAGPLGLDVDELSGGVVLDDFNNDGYLDLMVSAFGFHGQLRFFYNHGDGTFTDLTDRAGLRGLTGGLNLIQADYNNDGFVDVFVLRGAWLDNEGRFPNSLLKNNGDGTFTDVTEEAGLLSFHPTQTGVWFDYNGDGKIDLFVGNESTSADSAHPCELYRNNGDGTFTECAADNGVAVVGFVKGVTAGDFNRDGRPDLFLSVREAPNLLFRNDGVAERGEPGGGSWKFTEVAAAAGVTQPIVSFPCWFWDYDNDGWDDLMVFGYKIKDVGDVAADYLGQSHGAEKARLYRNNRDGTFSDVSKATRLDRVVHAMGCNFGDLDNDGWLDFYAGTGDPFLGTLIPNRMFRGNGGNDFQDVTTSGGFGNLQKGHAIAFGDINNDGAQDIYSVLGGAYPGDNYRNQLLANPGHGNHWIKLKLEGVKSNRSAIGAVIKVVVKTKDGTSREMVRTVSSGGSFGAASLRQEIGLGDARALEEVKIFWPATGDTQVVKGLEVDRTYVIREREELPREVVTSAFAWPTSERGAESTHQH